MNYFDISIILYSLHHTVYDVDCIIELSKKLILLYEIIHSHSLLSQQLSQLTQLRACQYCLLISKWLMDRIWKLRNYFKSTWHFLEKVNSQGSLLILRFSRLIPSNFVFNYTCFIDMCISLWYEMKIGINILFNDTIKCGTYEA